MMELSQELIDESGKLFGPLITMYGANERMASDEPGLLVSDRPEVAGFGYGPAGAGTWGFNLDALKAHQEDITQLSDRIITRMISPGASFDRDYLQRLLGGNANMVIAGMVVSGLWHVYVWGDGCPSIFPWPPEGHTPFSYWTDEEEELPEGEPEPFNFDEVVERWMAQR